MVKIIPDICMCLHEGCKIKEICYRNRAIPNPNNCQSYIDFKYICREDNRFPYLYDIGDKPIRQLEVEQKEELIEPIIEESEELKMCDYEKYIKLALQEKEDEESLKIDSSNLREFSSVKQDIKDHLIRL